MQCPSTNRFARSRGQLRGKRLRRGGQDFARAHLPNLDHVHGAGALVPLHDLDHSKVAFARDRQIGGIFMAVHLRAACACADASDSRLRHEVQENGAIRHPDALETGQPGGNCKDVRNTEIRKSPARFGTEPPQLQQVLESVIDVVHRSWIAGRTTVVECPPGAGKQQVPVADHHVDGVALRQLHGRVVLQEHLEHLGRRVQGFVLDDDMREFAEHPVEPRRDRVPMRVKARTRDVDLRGSEPEFVGYRRPRDEPLLGGDHHGKRGRERALAAAVDADDCDLKGHAARPGTKARTPATSSFSHPVARSGSSSRKNSTESRSRKRMANTSPASSLRRKSRPRRGRTINPTASSPIATPGSGSGGSGRFKVTAARSRTLRLPSISTISQRDADTVPASIRVAPNARYSSLFTLSRPISDAARLRPAAWRSRHRAMSPATRPHSPSPHMVTAYRVAVPPSGRPCVQRSTPHGVVTFRAKRSPTRRAAATGSMGMPSLPATTLPDPMRSAASFSTSALGGADGKASITPSTTARSVPPPPAASTNDGLEANFANSAAAARASGWLSTTIASTSSADPWPERSASLSWSTIWAVCPVPDARLRMRSAEPVTVRLRRPLPHRMPDGDASSPKECRL